MKVKLLHASPISVLVQAIRTCWSSQHKSDSEYNDKGEYVLNTNDLNLIQNVIKKDHLSCLEHVTFSFEIQDISRACLQEIVRHRIGMSFSVKSTRYTLQQLKHEKPFILLDDRVKAYIKLTGNNLVDSASLLALEHTRSIVQADIANDQGKYSLPESFLTTLVLTCNARSLRHFLKLRSSKHALPEIRDLSKALYTAIPMSYMSLFFDITIND